MSPQWSVPTWLRSATDRIDEPTRQRMRDKAESVGGRARAVGRETKTRSRLVRDIVMARGDSAAAQLVREAAQDSSVPGLSALMAAGHQVFVDPSASWDLVDLEAMAVARVDPEIEQRARVALAGRLANLEAVVASARRSGSIDPAVSDAAIVHMSMALSAGLALIAPVLPTRASPEEWDRVQARIGVAFAPPDLSVETTSAEDSVRWRLRVDVPDRPGSSARLFRALAALHANTTYLQINGVEDGLRTIEMGLRAPRIVSQDAVVAAAGTAATNVHITEGRVGDDGDLFAQVLDAAGNLVRHPEWAPEIAAQMVAAEEFEVVDATEGESDEVDVLRLQWTTQKHVLLRRHWAPFARAEQARVSALLRLAAAAAKAAGAAEGANGWISSVGSITVWIRLARPEDADLVRQMHERTSERSRYQRYFAHTKWKDVQLRRLAGGHRGATLVAQSRGGEVIALGNVFPEVEGSATAEIAVIVEDAYQGMGLGREMLRKMIDIAVSLGFREVLAEVLTENRGMQRLLETTGLEWTSHSSEGVRTMRAFLPVSHTVADADAG